jgi:hypothetical protein
MIEDVAHRRGSRYQRHVVVNDISLTIPAAAAAAMPPALTDPEIGFFPDERIPTRLMFNIVGVTDSLEFALIACPQVLDKTENDQFARGLLALVAAAAAGPVPLSSLTDLTGVRPGVRTDDWQVIDGSWIDLSAVDRLLTETLGVPHHISLVDGRLHAHLAYPPPPPALTEIHHSLVTRLGARDTAMTPHHYHLHADSLDGPLLAEGDGRDPQVTDWQAELG